MPLIDQLGSGALGVTFEPPEDWCVHRDDDVVEAIDRKHRAQWWMFAVHGLHLDIDIDDDEHMRGAAEAYARGMFELAHDGDQPPRTSDPTWSPLVAFDRIEIMGAPALSSLHRMHYRPGREFLFGHLLIPRPWGLFEARVGTLDQTTGWRECAQLVALSPEGDDMGSTLEKLTQATYDDPALDEKFPQHCLSRAREAMRWMQGNLTVESAALPRCAGAIEVPAAGFAITPPPRFFATSQPTTFLRTSFCATDGLENFIVEPKGDIAIQPEHLVAVAEGSTRQIHLDAEVADLKLEVQIIDHVGRSDVLVIADGKGHLGGLRNGLLWLLDPGGRPWSLSLTAAAQVPRQQVAQELIAAARTWRPVGPR